jgi:carboxymethylenebutenolidase
VARKYAARGYLVATPDLFWRIDPGPLAVADDGERARAFARLAKLEFEEAFAGFERVIDAVCRLPQADGRYAIVGICLGGEYAFVAAARLRPAAIATLHGTAMGKHLEEADTIACPLSLHFGEGDEIVPMSEVAAISAAVGGRERATIVTYAGAGHGFSLPRMPGYDAAAAASGWAAVSAIVDEMRSGPM